MNKLGQITLVAAIYLMIALVGLCRWASGQPLGDADGNRLTNLGDCREIAAMMGRIDRPDLDVNGDGVVNSADFTAVAKAGLELANYQRLVLTDPRMNAALAANTVGDNRVRFAAPRAGGTNATELRSVFVNGGFITIPSAVQNVIGGTIVVNGMVHHDVLLGRPDGWWRTNVALNSSVESATTTYWLRVWMNGQVTNLFASGGTSTIVVNPPRPDLAVTDTTILPAGPYLAGQNVSINATVRSTSVQPLQNVLVRGFVLGANNQLVQLDGDVRLNFGAGSEAQPVSFPATLSTTSSRFNIVVDPLNAILESKEGNNQTTAVVTATLPNYSVTSLSVTPPTTIEGRQQLIRGIATGGEVRILVGGRTLIPGAGSISGEFTAVVTAVAGTTTVTAVVDLPNLVAESDETDNRRSVVVPNQLPDYSLRVVEVTPNPVPVGDTVRVRTISGTTGTAVVRRLPIQIRSNTGTVVASSTALFDPFGASQFTDLSFGAQINTTYSAVLVIGNTPDARSTDNQQVATLTVTVPPGPAVPVIQTVMAANGGFTVNYTGTSGGAFEITTGSSAATLGSTRPVTGTMAIVTGLPNKVGTFFSVRALNNVGQKSAWSTAEVVYPGSEPVPVTWRIVTDTTNSDYTLFGDAPIDQPNPLTAPTMAKTGTLEFKLHGTALAGRHHNNGYDRADTSASFPTQYLDARERTAAQGGFGRPVSFWVNGTRIPVFAYTTRGGGDYWYNLSSAGAATATSAP
ncbi:hypothetical protein HZA86_01975 [Candidatus Uhrbacteria bacterium]|nr:hypothetical protein [Candidatus Uhrbacteria bacterium]